MTEPTLESLNEAARAAGWHDYRDIGMTTQEAYTSIRAHAATLDLLHNRKPPVDPLLIEAREICANGWEARERPTVAQKYRAGEYDDDFDVKLTLDGLKRGMELAQPKQPTLDDVREWLAVTYEAAGWSGYARIIRADNYPLMVKSLHASITGARGE